MAANQETEVEVVKMGPGGVPEGSKTAEFYRTDNIPTRFDNPDWFQGYGGKDQHPMYRTTSCTYGAKPPSVHTMPTTFHCRSQKFSEQLGKCGMYRNHSLNTALDISRV
ncbi:piercer of microtubule wall 1 protein-like [Ylistrum balloti]|uniref:piercer of microtubule wall 1 protein-like n=1 Tax=Ylistrum balloti TaxID=509963 RepID=UPI002905E1DB|nr:piercer of microtubule wall 1 protein-like [Ylistrum balloti]